MIGIADAGPQMHQLFRARFQQLGITLEDVDYLAGLTKGHASMLLAPKPRREMVTVTFWPFLKLGLGCKLALIEDEEATKFLRSRVAPRRLPQRMLAVKNGRGQHQLVSKRFLKKIAVIGGQAYVASRTPRQHRMHAKKMARARWGRRVPATKAAKARWGSSKRKTKRPSAWAKSRVSQV